MAIRRGRRVASGRIKEVLENLLEASKLCAIATVAGSRAYVNTAYFAWSSDFRLVWISDPEAQHSKNLGRNSSVAVAVFDSGQVWGKPDRGLQLIGRASEVGGRRADAARGVYAARFPDYEGHGASAYQCYEFRPRRAKLFDETKLGGGVFVTARISATGSVSWERTELYPGAS